jgi:hypothetical protein
VTTRAAAAKPSPTTTAKGGGAAPDEDDEDDEELDGFEPVLELDTLAPKRPTVRIRTPENRDGELYDMRLPEEFGIEEEQLYRAELREYGELMGKDKLTSAERKSLKARLRSLAGKILIAPGEVIGELKDRQQQAVITNFTAALFAEDATVLDDAMKARLLGSIMAS